MLKKITLKVTCLSLLFAYSTGNMHAQSTGTVYFSSGALGSPAQLYKLQNPGTASVTATPVGSATTPYNGIGYSSADGNLYGVTYPACEIVRISPTDGSVTHLNVFLPGGHNYAAGEVVGSTMYVSNQDGGTDRALYRINLTNNTYTSVTIGIGLADLVYMNGYLFGYNATANMIYRIDPNTGATSAATGGASFGPGGVAAIWTTGNNTAYFDRRGTYVYNTTTNQDVGTGTNTTGVAGSGSGMDDATWSPLSSVTPITNGGTIAANESNCGPFDPAAITSTADASGGSGAPIEYRWWANGSIIAGATTATYDPGLISVTTNYQREARRGNTDWIASNTVTKTVNAAPNVSIAVSGGTPQCHTDPITLTASGAASYSWSTGATTAAISVNPAAATTYTVTGTAANGCIATASQSVDPAIIADVTSNPATSTSNRVCAGTSVTLTATGGDSYTWLDAATTSASRTVAATNGDQTYTVVAHKTGCTNGDTASVTVYGQTCQPFDLIANITTPFPVIYNNTATSLTFEVINITPAGSQGNIQFNVIKPPVASGLTLTFPVSIPGWTITSNNVQITFTSTTPIEPGETRSVTGNLSRSGGSSGEEKISMDIVNNTGGDTNPANNHSDISFLKP